MNCPECDHLLTEHDHFGRAYTVAIHTLTTKAGVSSREEYAAMRIAADDARQVWEFARMRLLEHQKAHEIQPHTNI
jgi:hypothetical protein